VRESVGEHAMAPAVTDAARYPNRANRGDIEPVEWKKTEAGSRSKDDNTNRAQQRAAPPLGSSRRPVMVHRNTRCDM